MRAQVSVGMRVDMFVDVVLCLHVRVRACVHVQAGGSTSVHEQVCAGTRTQVDICANMCVYACMTM